MTDGDGITPTRRTVRISDGDDGAAPGTGGLIDPLLAGRAVSPAPPEPAAPPAAEPASGGPKVVVIGDDGLPDATYTVSPARTPDQPGQRGPRVDPRMKARRIAVRRAAGRRRLWWGAVVAVVLVVGFAALAVFSSSLFDVEQVEVTGAVNSDPSQIAEITDDLLGKAILTVDLGSIAERLEQLPWVRYAEVRMDFPHTVRVQIAERTPVAAFQSADSRWRVIDVDGRVIAVLAGRPIDYVAIFGPGPDKIAGEDALDYAKVAQFVTALPPRLRPLVQHFTVDAQLDVTMTLRLKEDQETEVELCSARDLDTDQLVSLAAFVQTRLEGDRTPPARITACGKDLITTTERRPEDVPAQTVPDTVADSVPETTVS